MIITIFEAWLVSSQFIVINTNNPIQPGQTNNLLGYKVSFPGTDRKSYTGIIKEIQGNNYKVKYDNYDFEAWLVREQFTIVNATTTNQATNTQPTYTQNPHQKQEIRT